MYFRLKFKKIKSKSETKFLSNSIDNISKIEKLKSNSKILHDAKNNNAYLNKSLTSKQEYPLFDTSYLENKNNNSLSHIDKIPKKPKTRNSTDIQKTNLKGRFSVFLPKTKLKLNENFQNDNINAQETKTSKSVIQNTIQNLNARPKISQKPIEIAKKFERFPLYENPPLNEIKFVSKSFQYFYDCNKDEQNKNSTNNKKVKNFSIKEIEKKFANFYEDNLKWKKNIMQANENIRKLKEAQLNEDISKIPFKPNLNKKSLKMANLIKISYSQNFYEERLNKEKLDIFKLKIKPIMLNKFRNKSEFITKKKTHYNKINNRLLLNKSTSYNNFKNKINIGVIHIDKIEKTIYKNNEKKSNFNSKKKNKILDFKKANEEEKNEKKRICYKLNVRQGGAWNQNVVNNIVFKKNQQYIVEGVL